MTKRTRFVLDLSLEQAMVVEHALDVFGRIGHGQIKIVAEALQNFHDLGETEVDVARAAMKTLAEALGLPPQGFGISHKDTPEDAKVAHDVQKTLQKSLAEATHMLRSNWYDGPLRRPKGQATSSYYHP